ncbi:MAG: methyl-accepting chemotaxis protein, partial [Deltaproteobacteria bacterium]|nr:methyl-accepting chemotaxis protein [Deltaproteobacteria bacterium]
MNIFKNMKIGLRLGLGFGAVMLIFAAVIIITILSLKTATNSAKHVAGESLPFALLADEMAFNVVQVQQFLTDVSATHDTEVYKEAEDAAKGFMQGITKFKDMFKRKNDAKSLKEIEDLEAAFNKFYESGKYMANVYITQGIEAGNKIMEELDKTAETLSKKTAEFKRIQVDEANVNANGIVRVVYKVQIIQFVLGIVAMLLGGLIAFFITISIKRPLSQGILLAEAIAEGDLTCKIDKAVLDIGGEVGHLIRGLGKMSDSLKDSLMQIEMLAARLASVSEELSASSVQIAKGAESQTQKASQVATASTEMSATIVEIARSTS